MCVLQLKTKASKQKKKPFIWEEISNLMYQIWNVPERKVSLSVDEVIKNEVSAVHLPIC